MNFRTYLFSEVFTLFPLRTCFGRANIRGGGDGGFGGFGGAGIAVHTVGVGVTLIDASFNNLMHASNANKLLWLPPQIWHLLMNLYFLMSFCQLVHNLMSQFQ